MNIIIFLVSVLLNLASSFLLMYAFDEPKIWRSKDDKLKLRKPETSDLLTANQFSLSSYVEQVICPAYYYFVLRNETFPEKNEDSGSIMYGLFFQFPTLFLSYRGLYKTGIIESRSICYVLVCVLCAIGSFLLHKVYINTLKIDQFEESMDSLYLLFMKNTRDEKHDISPESAFNNFAINFHMNYLLSIKETVRSRRVLRRYINSIALLIYILAFMPTEPI